MAQEDAMQQGPQDPTAEVLGQDDGGDDIVAFLRKAAQAEEAGPPADVGDGTADEGMDTKAEDDGDADDSAVTTEAGQKPARASALARKLREAEEELERLRSERGTQAEAEHSGPTDPDEFWDDYQTDRLAAIKKLVRRHVGDGADAEVEDLMREAAEDYTGLSKTDEALAARRRMRQIEREALATQRRLQRQLEQSERAEAQRTAERARANDVLAVRGVIDGAAAELPYLAMSADAAEEVYGDLVENVKRGNVVLTRENAAEVVKQLAAARNTYYRQMHARVKVADEGKRPQKRVASKKSPSNREASETTKTEASRADDGDDIVSFLRRENPGALARRG